MPRCIRSRYSGPPPRVDCAKLAWTDTAETGHRIKHAAISAGVGAGVGVVLGATIGWGIDKRPGDGFMPAAPFVASEGLAIGLVVGLVAGAMVR